MLGLVSNAPAAEYPGKHMELKVDFGYSDDPSTWKPGWLPWASWNDEDRHDMKLFANIGGSTIDACISVGHEGDLALGEDLEENVDDEPICNSFMHYYRSPPWYYEDGKDPGHSGGDILLFLTREGGLEPGEYWLYSYHRHPADMNDIQKIEVTCSKDGRWVGVASQYSEYGEEPIGEEWLTGDINCPNDPCGVIQIHDNDTYDVNVAIEGDPNRDGDPCHDADLTPSLVKFYTDGAPVLIRYWAPDDGPDTGSCAVLNAFILLGPVPKAAWGPVPRNRSEDACPDANLTWHPGEYVAYEGDANGHDVYFGTDWNDVNNATVAEPCGVYIGCVNEPNYDPPDLLELDTTYYWRIDEVNNANPNSPWRGSTWSFTTEDGKAREPSPGDGTWSVPTDANLSWTASCLAIKHDVYFSTNFVDVNTGSDPNSGAGQGRQTETMFDLPILEPFTRYYWRVDEKGATTFVRGDVWTFVTAGGVLMYFKFDGVEDANIGDACDANLVTDSTGNVTFRKRGDYTSLTYGPSNPLINPSGTSAHFHQWEEDIPDEDDIQHEVGLLRDVEGPDILDLAGEAYTIEMWIKQDSFYSENVGDDDYAATLFRKYNRSYVLAIGEDKIVRYGHSGSTITSVPDANFPLELELGRWYHIAAVFDSTDPCEPQKLYINGEQVSGGGTSSPNPLNDDDYVGIGFTKQPQRVGPGLEQNFFNGLIDEFRITDVALNPNKFLIRVGPGMAWFPKPQDYYKDIQFNVDLSWKPGDYTADVNGHDVYIGTDWYEVNEASTTVHPNVGYVNLDVNSYDIPYFLNLDQICYWRVDQFNDACQPDPWKGTIWRFKVAEYVVIDDFEDYENTEDLWGSWIDGGGNSTGAFIGLQSTSPVNTGDKSMQYLYYIVDFGCGSYYAQIQTKNLDPNNWDVFGLRILSLWFYGKSDNDADDTEQMYVGIEDSDGTYAEVRYPMADMDDIRVEEWQLWDIFLSDFTNVNLAKLEKLFIGFGTRGSSTPGGTGTVHFDDIRLYPPTCRPDKIELEGDLNYDCIVDFGDVEIMADEWLEADVNLGAVTQPSDANLVGWWNFDENNGDGNVVTDSSGNGHDGVIETNDVDVYWVAGRNDVNYALEFDGGRVRVTDAPLLRPTKKLTVCAWIQYFEEQDSARIVCKGANDKETFSLEVGDEDRAVFLVRDANNPDDNKYDVNSIDRLDRGDWIHLAGTYDNNSVKFYLNGELKDTLDDPNAWGITLSQDTNDLAIGNRSDDDENPFEGIIDEVRLYNRVLSAEEIAWLATDGTKIFSVQSVANLYNKEALGRRAVNLRDFAELAKDWLEKQLWPP